MFSFAKLQTTNISYSFSFLNTIDFGYFLSVIIIHIWQSFLELSIENRRSRLIANLKLSLSNGTQIKLDFSKTSAKFKTLD